MEEKENEKPKTEWHERQQKIEEEPEKPGEEVSLSEAKGFGGIQEEYSNFKKAKVVVLPVPYEKTTTYKRGTRNGPLAIIDASTNMELFDEELNQETYKIGIHTMDALRVDGLSPEDMVERVKASTLEILKAGKFPMALGGEHSITVGVVKAFCETFENISTLQLDAHYDLRDEYLGSKFSHACVGRRLSELCPLVQVGTRSLSREEREFLDSVRKQSFREAEKDKTEEDSKSSHTSIRCINVYEILDRPFWKDEVLSFLTDEVYVTIDLDVLDPSLMPSVGTPEPGGMGWYDLLELLRSVTKEKKVVGFDVVELSPIKDRIAPDFTAAKLIYRFLGLIFSNKR